MGGPQRYALEVCRHFAGKGEDVTALTRDAKGVDVPFSEAGIRLRHAPLRDYPDFFSSQILRRILCERPDEPTVIHTHRYRDALTAVAARRMSGLENVGIIVTRHKSEPGKNNMLRRLIYREVDAHVFVSEFSKDMFLSAWPSGRYPFDSRRLSVAYNGRRTIPQRVDEPEKGAVTAMWHGTIRPGKGLETMLKTMAEVKCRGNVKLRLRIAGTGNPDYVDSLRSAATRYGIMELIDWVRNVADPLELISKSHFGVLPCEEPEAFGLSNLEYMMAGRSQVTTFNGAQGEYMTDGVEALGVIPGDVAGLADAMERLALDAELRNRLGKAAGERYDRELSWPIFIGRIETIYRDVCR